MRILSGEAMGALVGMALATGAARAEDCTIGYSQFWGTNPFLVTMANGAKKAIGEWAAKDVKVGMLLTNGGDTYSTPQVADLEDLYAQGVQGLILLPPVTASSWPSRSRTSSTRRTSRSPSPTSA